ncbi:glutathione ABC transporter substrate-binding protein [Shouchella shacheensis]|uniref:glutathione ABC transporter substrate-binding protein n=1 Tax=Shouchella shacheensis TaxID=1649580 RepID=UPI00074013E7|nr:glutathione ABC transporter substrate-binding protein [Shouchella shacheensis]
MSRQFSLKNASFGLMLSFMLFMVAACATEPTEGDETEGDASDGQASEGEEGGEGGDLLISMLSEAVSLDVHGSNDTYSSNMTSQIYETLVQHDADLELQPDLAEDWDQIEDTVWEFELREGVTFHDGAEFNAEAVKANFDRILDTDIASQRAFLYEMVTEVEVVDDYTVRFHTEYPFAPLPAHLAHDGGSIMSPESIEADYAAMEEGEEPGSYINANASGTGYFAFDEWVQGDYIRLTKNEDYWGEPAKVDTVTVRVVPEGGTRMAELQSGNAHIIDPISPNDLAEIEATDGITVDTQESVMIMYVGFNAEQEYLDNSNVRKAISLAIDRGEVLEAAYDGVGIEAKSPLAPAVFGYDESIESNEHNLDEARQLLAEEGLEDGFDITFHTSDEQERQYIAEYVQSALEEININVSIDVQEWGSFLDFTAEGNQEMFVLSWSTVTGDGDYGLYPLFHSSNQGAPGNRTFTDSEELDEWLEIGRESSDEAERLEAYREVQNYIAKEAIIQPLVHQDYMVGLSEDVQGFWQHPTRKLMLQDVTIN